MGWNSYANIKQEIGATLKYSALQNLPTLHDKLPSLPVVQSHVRHKHPQIHHSRHCMCSSDRVRALCAGSNTE
jgi:hypothetical protein